MDIDNTLYYESSASDNTTSVDPDPSLATDYNVRYRYLYRTIPSQEQRTGTMPDNPPYTINLPPSTDNSISMYIIPRGYHSGTGKVVADNLRDSTPGDATAEDIATNKVAWVNGQRVVGTLDIDRNAQIGNATPEDIIDTRVAWVNGEKVVGTMPYNFRHDINLSAGESYTIPKGYHSGNAIISARNLYEQTRGTASANTIKTGFTAWVNGEKVVGTYDAQSEIDELIAQTNTLTENVLEGHKFFSKPYTTVVTGTMPDHTGEAPIELENGDVWNIPEGYYNGLSKVTVPNLSDVTPGTAISDDIAENKTAWVNGEKIIGSMATISPESNTILAGETYIIPKGYHSGIGLVIAETLANQTVADAINTDIRKDKTAWVNGVKITGSMSEYGVEEYISLAASERYNIPTGYHEGGKVIAKSLASQTEGDAYPKDLLEGKTAWVNGVKIEGTITNIQPAIINLESSERYRIPKGYHTGNGFVIAPNTSEDTPGDATANDIIKDKTAWVYGQKITGILDPNGLTGTVTEGDVLAGKTFYNTSFTEKRTGTLELIGNATPEYVFRGKTFYNTDAKTILEGTMDLNGTAATIQVLEGQTFYTTDPSMKYTGTMPNRGAIERELNPGESYTIPNGYHNGAGIIRAKDISSQTDGTAKEADLLYEKTAWVRGVKLTGTMPDRGAVSQTIDAGQNYIIPKGYHNGLGTISAKPNIPSYMVNDQGEVDPAGEQLVLVPNTNPSTYDDDNEQIILP